MATTKFMESRSLSGSVTLADCSFELNGTAVALAISSASRIWLRKPGSVSTCLGDSNTIA